MLRGGDANSLFEMDLLFEEETDRGFLSYGCPGCSWTRNVVKGSAGEKRIQHLVYGRKSLAEIALLDVAHHDCGEYFAAVARLEARRRGKLILT